MPLTIVAAARETPQRSRRQRRECGIQAQLELEYFGRLVRHVVGVTG